MSKLTSGGNILWFRDIGGSGATAKGSGIAVDGSGNVYVSGSASGAKINFGPSVSLQPAGSQDGFVSQQDGNGDFGWVEDVAAPATRQVTGIAADPSGNVYSPASSAAGRNSTRSACRPRAFRMASWPTCSPGRAISSGG